MPSCAVIRDQASSHYCHRRAHKNGGVGSRHSQLRRKDEAVNAIAANRNVIRSEAISELFLTQSRLTLKNAVCVRYYGDSMERINSRAF